MAKSRKKVIYWHNVARLCIEYGFKPAQVAKVIKSIFPMAEVTGRHVGAYKRRLASEGTITEVLPSNLISIGDMIEQAKDMVTGEDMFIYKCAVGSHKRSLKCFEYKLTAEVEDEIEKVEAWIRKIK